jgi:hypothetical protein
MIPTLRRIPKELLPQFLCDLQGLEKNFLSNGENLSQRSQMRYYILHRLYPASPFDWDDITVNKSAQHFSRNKTHTLLEEGNT